MTESSLPVEAPELLRGASIPTSREVSDPLREQRWVQGFSIEFFEAGVFSRLGHPTTCNGSTGEGVGRTLSSHTPGTQSSCIVEGSLEQAAGVNSRGQWPVERSAGLCPEGLLCPRFHQAVTRGSGSGSYMNESVTRGARRWGCPSGGLFCPVSLSFLRRRLQCICLVCSPTGALSHLFQGFPHLVVLRPYSSLCA